MHALESDICCMMLHLLFVLCPPKGENRSGRISHVDHLLYTLSRIRFHDKLLFAFISYDYLKFHRFFSLLLLTPRFFVFVFFQGIQQCQYQFRNERWNCTTKDDFSNVFGSTLERGEYRFLFFSYSLRSVFYY